VRNPQTRRGKNGRPLPYGTTRTLANGLLPFGWAKLEFPDIPAGLKKDRSWSFPLNTDHIPASHLISSVFFKPAPEDFDAFEEPETTPSESVAPIIEKTGQSTVAMESTAVITETQSPVEKLLKELETIKATDAGRIGTVIQKMEELETIGEKAQIAVAIRNKVSSKAFKKHKKKDYLLQLIQKAGL
jgi:hypothetical protein